MKTKQISCDLEVLTFIHIGSGEEIQPPEMFMESKQFHRIDMGGLFQDPKFNHNDYLNRLDSTDTQQFQLSDIDPRTPLDHKIYSLGLGSKIKTHEICPVREMMKTARSQLYIPGSSIKGAIRTALFWHVLNSLGKQDSKVKDFLVAVLSKNFRDIEYLAQKPPFSAYQIRIDTRNRNLGQRLFELLTCLVSEKVGKGYTNYKHREARFLRWLEVSDTDKQDITIKNSRLMQISTFNTSRRIPLRFEVLSPGNRLTFTMNESNSNFKIKQILDICDNFYNRVIDAEQRWFEENRLETASFHENLKKREGKIRLGQGSGSWTTSFLVLADQLGLIDEYVDRWQITKYGREPKTRKLVQNKKGDKFPLGWARIRIKEEGLN